MAHSKGEKWRHLARKEQSKTEAQQDKHEPLHVGHLGLIVASYRLQRDLLFSTASLWGWLHLVPEAFLTRHPTTLESPTA